MSPSRELHNLEDPLKAIADSVSGGDLRLLQSLRCRASPSSLRVYIVGGPVRDVLLGAPIKYLDFTLEGDAPKLARQLSGETGGRLVVHRRFRTATVILGESRVDVVTARKEVYSKPGALPTVSSGSIHDDLARRDFSINSLALPLWEDSPQILSFHGGIEDLAAGVVRALHQGSFADDPTRILRAIRYEQRLGFSLDAETVSQLQDAVAQGYLAAVSGERLRHELERILDERHPDRALTRALQLGVLAAIHPALDSGAALERLLAAEFGIKDWPDQMQLLSALVYSLSPLDGREVIQRLNLPSPWARMVRDTIQLREMESRLSEPTLLPSQIADLLGDFCPAAMLAVSRITESPAVSGVLKRYLDEYRFQVTSLNGRDLQDMGVPPGTMVGQVLRRLHQAKLDGQVASADEERQMVRGLLKSPGGQLPDG